MRINNYIKKIKGYSLGGLDVVINLCDDNNSIISEYEISTYRHAWRILKDSKIIMSSYDYYAESTDSIETTKKLEDMKLSIINIDCVGHNDYKFFLSNNILIEYFYVTNLSDEDYIFGVFDNNKTLMGDIDLLKKILYSNFN